MTLIDRPGVYPDIDPDDYHNDCVEGGSLSSSGARALLPPGCPARFHYERHNPPAPKPHFDIGHAAHRLVLGVGPNIVSIDVTNKAGEIVDNWQTKAAREQAEEIRATGAVPLLRKDYEAVHAMAEALRLHPIAGPLFHAGHGRAEVTLVWRDERTGIMRRCRLDWLPDPRRGRMIIPDYKTAHAADLEALSKAMGSYGYHAQADWNRAGCQALGLADSDAQFVLVAQEKTAPYLVTVFQPDHEAMRIGAMQNRIAIDVYKRCVETDRWPDHSDDGDGPEVAHLPLPAWIERQWSDT